jgi:hypothetical protein
LTAAALYVLNRLVLKPLTAGEAGTVHGFLHGHLNDVLCIPFCLPPLLFVEQKLGFRGHDGPPTRLEIAGSVAIWSAFFEWAAPRVFLPVTVGDAGDVAAYAGGAIVAGLIWGSLRPAPRVRSRGGHAVWPA